MIALNKQKSKILTLGTILALVFSLTLAPTRSAFADYSVCRSDACKAAQAAEEEARQKSSEATNAAQTVEGEIAKLDVEIAGIEANINTSVAMVNDLKQQIKETEEKLDTQQNGLASLLVQMHFDSGNDAVSLLAGSKTLSDYAEKQARNETIKSQIAAGIETIKELKEDLEGQKADVERLILEQEGQREAVAAKRAEQNELAEKYRDDAAAFAADAEARHQEMLAEVEWIRTQVQASSNIGGNRSTAGYDTYEYRNQCLGTYNGMAYGVAAIYNTWTGHGGYRCQCVDYAGWKVWEYTNHRVNAYNWGNANMWPNTSQAYYPGVWVDNVPAANTVAVSYIGGYGHVMWVESVNADGTLTISEYNYFPYVYSTGTVYNPSSLAYIHLDNYR